MIQAYPLQWPAGWKRTQYPESSRFSPGSVSIEALNVTHELELLGANNVVISSNMQYRSDGLPYSRQSHIGDTGVAVYFTLNGDQQCIPCDKWFTVSENLRAVWKTIEALRGIERWGAKDMMNAAFRGFKALPESVIPNAYTAQPWYDVLEVSPNASPEVIKSAYKQLALKHHPDQGGDSHKFQQIQAAWNEARRGKEWR